jgi:hypothetical protein
MKNYLLAKNVWDSLSVSERKNVLQQHGRHHTLSSRCYPFIPKEIRADIQSDLLKKVPQEVKQAHQVTPHWTEIY